MSNTDSNLTLDTQIILDIENIKTVLEMIPRRVENGCIVKICREVLFELLTHQQSLSYPHIYGIVTNLEEVCPHSGLRAWEVRWYLIHQSILPAGHDYSYLATQLEIDLLIVNWPEDEVAAVGEDYCLKWYFVRVDDCWKMKDLDNVCEFCDSDGCDRMVYKDDLNECLDEGHDNDYLENNARRHMLYGMYVRMAYGSLRVGDRRTIQVCCAKLICLNFPSFDGYTGFQLA